MPPSRAFNVEITLAVRAVFLALVVIVGFAVVWTQRAALLTALGGLVAEETPLGKADLLVIIGEAPRLAVEAAELVKKGYAPRVVLFATPPQEYDLVLVALGVKVPKPHEIALEILKASGVAAPKVAVLPRASDGTNASAREVGRYAKAHGVTRVIAVTYRSHTRRAAYLLRRELTGPGAVIIRAAPRDPFRPDSWWRERGQARELALEGLRWLNSTVLEGLSSRGDRASSYNRAGLQRSPAP